MPRTSKWDGGYNPTLTERRAEHRQTCDFCSKELTPTDTYSCPRCGWKVEAK